MVVMARVIVAVLVMAVVVVAVTVVVTGLGGGGGEVEFRIGGEFFEGMDVRVGGGGEADVPGEADLVADGEAVEGSLGGGVEGHDHVRHAE